MDNDKVIADIGELSRLAEDASVAIRQLRFKLSESSEEVRRLFADSCGPEMRTRLLRAQRDIDEVTNDFFFAAVVCREPGGLEVLAHANHL